MKLRRKSIDRIHKIIYLISAKHITGLLCLKIFLNDYKVKFRVYILKAFRQHFTFLPAYCRIQSQKLTVLVCDRDIITVQNNKVTYTGAYNHFRSISSYASYTDDRNSGITEMIQHFFTYKHCSPFLPIVYHSFLRCDYSPFALPSSQMASISARVMSVRLRPLRMVCSSRYVKRRLNLAHVRSRAVSGFRP